MPKKTNLTTAVSLVALMTTTGLTTPALAQNRLSDDERRTLQERALSELRSLGYNPSQFDDIRVRVQRNEIDLEASGDDIDVDLTYARNGNSLGSLIEGDVDIDDGERDIERVFAGGSWSESVSDDDEDEEDDEDEADEADDEDEDDEDEDESDEDDSDESDESDDSDEDSDEGDDGDDGDDDSDEGDDE